jgi:hypothetical protein
VPSYEITEEDINYFLKAIRAVKGSYPKIRDLQKLLRPRLDLFKINTILRYLERSKRLETDLDGNIIWIREDSNNANRLSMAERANVSREFLDFLSKKAVKEKTRLEEEKENEEDNIGDNTKQ